MCNDVHTVSIIESFPGCTKYLTWTIQYKMIKEQWFIGKTNKQIFFFLNVDGAEFHPHAQCRGSQSRHKLPTNHSYAHILQKEFVVCNPRQLKQCFLEVFSHLE